MYTSEAKVEEFLNEYKRSRVIIETSVMAVLYRALKFEQEFRKAFYEFSVKEVLDMYKSYHAINIRSLQNTNLILKHFAKWTLHEQGLSTDNVYDTITKNLIEDCVDIKKKEGLIFSKDDIEDIQSQLLNWTDKGILLMLFLGAGANWLKELTFFNMNQVSREDKLIYFKTGKIIPITDEDYEIIEKACEEDELMSFGTTSRISRVRSEGLYKIRFNALSSNSNPNNEEDAARRFRWTQRRLLLISQDLGIRLTSSSLQASGLLHYLQQGMKESGLSFREYTKTEGARSLARRYDIYSELAPQILLEKFEMYFE